MARYLNVVTRHVNGAVKDVVAAGKVAEGNSTRIRNIVDIAPPLSTVSAPTTPGSPLRSCLDTGSRKALGTRVRGNPFSIFAPFLDSHCRVCESDALKLCGAPFRSEFPFQPEKNSSGACQGSYYFAPCTFTQRSHGDG